MKDIPADVRAAAVAARDAYADVFHEGYHVADARTATTEAIARAIMAERERIAKEAEQWDGYAKPGEIAAMIRGKP